MRAYLGVLSAAVVLMASPSALASGSGSSGSPSGMISTEGAMRTRNEAAKAAFLSAVRTLNSAKSYEADSAKAATAEKSAKAQAKAEKYYQEALGKLIDVVGLDPGMVEAWNYLGFSNRKLGRYQESLDSYAKALALNPNYPQAIEYRGEAYLGLNRIEDVKSAYMSLFQNSRPLADELMAAMHQWTDARRKDGQGLSPEEVDSFAKWIDERAGIARETASLARGAGTNWR